MTPLSNGSLFHATHFSSYLTVHMYRVHGRYANLTNPQPVDLRTDFFQSVHIRQTIHTYSICYDDLNYKSFRYTFASVHTSHIDGGKCVRSQDVPLASPCMQEKKLSKKHKRNKRVKKPTPHEKIIRALLKLIGLLKPTKLPPLTSGECIHPPNAARGAAHIKTAPLCLSVIAFSRSILPFAPEKAR